MMPGVGFEEMILLVVVAIIVVGPKDLPLMMRKFGRFTGKMRAMAFEFKQGFDELGRQAELDELRKEVANLKQHTGLEDLKKEFENEKLGLEQDVRSATAPVPIHPALGAAAGTAAVTEVKPEPLPYAGLSPEHPGYDAGEDFRIDGGMPTSTVPANGEPVNGEPANGAHVNGSNGAYANGDHVNGAPVNGEADAIHIIADEDVRQPAPMPAPIKQDTPA